VGSSEEQLPRLGAKFVSKRAVKDGCLFGGIDRETWECLDGFCPDRDSPRSSFPIVLSDFSEDRDLSLFMVSKKACYDKPSPIFRAPRVTQSKVQSKSRLRVAIPSPDSES
jgi:hypothetical protein